MFAIVIVGVLTFVGSPAHSEMCRTESPIPVAITLSGGVSLGAYQAGSLYFSSRVLRANPELFQARLLTGASAGALNALFAVLSICGNESAIPSESSFYKGWVAFKGKDLLAEKGEREALFSRNALQGAAVDLEAKWKQGLPVSCDVVLGLSVTRLKPLDDLSSIGFSRQAEKITIRVRGQGAGRAPRVTNYVNPSLFPKPVLLDLEDGNDAKNFESLKNVLFASSAFPVAFAPQSIRTCLAKTGDVWSHATLPYQCPASEVEDAAFVDGGILDNKPLALAEKISRMGLVADDCARTSWREIPAGVRDARDLGQASSQVLYLYSDLSATTYEKPKPKSENAFTVSPMLMGSVLNPSRNQDSSALMEQSPTLESQIAAPKNAIPRMGDSLLGFFGFFERDFRSFDFYLGLWETREYFTKTLQATLRRGGEPMGSQMKWPGFDPNSIDAKKIECLDLTFKKDERAEAACLLTEDRAFAILARLALARLEAQRADFQFMVEWLARERYEYRDLGLTADQAWRAPSKIKTEAIKAVSNLASAQSLADDFVLRTTGPLALNLIEPLPVERDFSITLGPQSTIASSVLLEQEGSFRTRFYLGVGLENYASWLGAENGRTIATPFGGLEFEPSRWNSGYIQTRFSLGGGYKFSDDPGTVVRAGGSLTVIERVRLQLDVEVMPFMPSGHRTPWQLLPSIGLQFYF